MEGNPIGEGGSKPLEEYQFHLDELDAWIVGIVESSWSRGARRVQSEGEKALAKYLFEQLSGIGVNEQQINAGIQSVSDFHPESGVPWSWGNDELMTLAGTIRSLLFPISIAANKADCVIDEGIWSDLSNIISNSEGTLVPSSAEAELALRRASKAGLITLNPVNSRFSITELGEKKLSIEQRTALENISEKLSKWGGGGLVGLLSSVVFDILKRRVVYPVQDDTHWVDGEGNILPDAILVSEGTTAKGLAYAVHSDLGDGFIRATDAKSSRVIGAEHVVQNGDIISIHAKT
jgi:ribosome-binding ATPase YchF (GTP1/OBG family)